MFAQSEFNAAVARKGMTRKEVAEALNVTETTLWRKLKRGGDFSRAEINTLIEVLDINDPMPIFFAS